MSLGVRNPTNHLHTMICIDCITPVRGWSVYACRIGEV